MNYKSFNLGDWIGHISGVIEDETTLDGNEMRDLVEFLSTLEQEPILDRVRSELVGITRKRIMSVDFKEGLKAAISILDEYKLESEDKE